jgi:hypothetical protein
LFIEFVGLETEVPDSNNSKCKCVGTPPEVPIGAITSPAVTVLVVV